MDHYAAVVALLEQHELFELLPTHGKVVTLDADLPMKHALAALASHSAMCLACVDQRAAPWGAGSGCTQGLAAGCAAWQEKRRTARPSQNFCV